MIGVEISAEEVVIEPGGTAQLHVTVKNIGTEEDRILLEVEGIDIEWYALPEPAVTAAAGQSVAVGILFRVPRSTECAAGAYPFLVRARSMESGEAGVRQATLTVKPFTSLQIDLDPKRATSTFIHPVSPFEVRVCNLGNQPETLDMDASDPEGACAYEFENARVTVRPGATETVAMYVEPKTRPVVGTARLYAFNVLGRSTADRYISTTVAGQVERKAFLSTVTAIVMLLAVISAVGYAILRPRPVVLRSFTASPTEVVAGDSVTLSWDIGDLGDGSYITSGEGSPTIPVTKGVGSVAVQPQVPTTYALVARGGGAEVRRAVAVAVAPRPEAPRARIAAFSASAKRIHAGEAVTLSWLVDGAAAMVLNPLGTLNPRLDRSRQVTPDLTTAYVLTVQGQNNDVVTKSVTVTVVPPDACTAEITGFKATPSTIHVGERATLRWLVDGAATVEIDNGVGSSLTAKGSFPVAPEQTTTYTLRAADNRGNIVTRPIIITVLPPDPLAGSTPPPVDGVGAGTPPPG